MWGAFESAIYGHSKRGLASEAVTRVLEQLEQNNHVQRTPHEISVKLVYGRFVGLKLKEKLNQT